ncbi:MAG: TolC family outer membrane protein [Stellaceae bacterium]|jgi:outer membrane protein
MRRVLAFVLGFSAVVSSTSGTRAETLEDALVETYNTNPQILAERANLRAVDEGVSQALGGWRPTVQFTASAGREKFEATPSTATVLSEGMADPRTLNLVMTQPLYQGGQTVAKTAQAEDSVKAERAHLVATESTVLFSVISAYLDVMRDQSVVDLDKLSEDVLSKTLDQTREQFRVGILTRTDVSQAEARLAAATAQRQQDEGTLQSDRANYARFVGHQPGDLIQPKLRPALPMTRDEALNLAAVKNPNVISALFTEEASRDFVTATEAQLLPSLNLVGQINRSDDPNFLTKHEETYGLIEAQVSMPIYEAGVIYSQSRQAKQQVGQSKNLTDDARRFAVQGATAAWETIQAQRANVISQITAIKADEVAYEGTKAQQSVGVRTVLDVLNAEQELFADRVNLAKAQHDLAVAEFNLAQQVGRLTAADLQLPVDLYDVERYYKEVRGKWFGFGPGQ